MIKHKPVLLEESIEALNLKPGDIVVDATLGGGGHSREILKKILPGGKLIAFDQDKNAIEKFRESLNKLKSVREKENVFLVNDNFSRLKNNLEILKIHPVKSPRSGVATGEFNRVNGVDAVIADLGISSDQLESDRGFSFQKKSPLDMRMDEGGKLTAFEVVNTYPQNELERILKIYGEEKFARSITKAIIRERKKGLIENTEQLVDIIAQGVPEKYKHQKLPQKFHQGGTRGRHFATRTFQAIRMEVNDELANLDLFLSQAVEALNPGGRVAIVSFHSGEDRIVKNIFRENARGCICPPSFPLCRCGQVKKLRLISRKPIVPSVAEIEGNPRSRSAKLRIAEKL